MRTIDIGMRLPVDMPEAAEIIQQAVDLLAQVNLVYLTYNPRTPEPGKSGVRYRREGRVKRERWQSIPEILKSGYADCEDLAAWLTASLRHKGIESRPTVSGKNGQYHIRVEAVIDGKKAVFDPSKDLGM